MLFLHTLFIFTLYRAPVDTSPVTEGVTLFKHRLLLLLLLLLLVDSIKAEHPSIDVAISSVILRSDDQSLNSKIDEVNRRNWVFIDNSNIKEDSLNRSGLHLNRKGVYRLASNFREYINGD